MLKLVCLDLTAFYGRSRARLRPTECRFCGMECDGFCKA